MVMAKCAHCCAGKQSVATQQVAYQQAANKQVARTCVAAVIAVVAIVAGSPDARAQLVLLAPSQSTITHDLTSNDQAFEDVIWTARNYSALLGSTVVLTCGPFVHEVQPASRANSQITLSIESKTLLSGWHTVIGVASTNIGEGVNTAIVAASSVLVGHADIRVQTKFLGQDPAALVAGSYRTTVTGTITAN